jgi:hypothetical protein
VTCSKKSRPSNDDLPFVAPKASHLATAITYLPDSVFANCNSAQNPIYPHRLVHETKFALVWKFLLVSNGLITSEHLPRVFGWINESKKSFR